MKPTTFAVALALALALFALPQALAAEEVANRSLAVCKSVAIQSDKTALSDLPEGDLRDKLCLSSLSVVRSADPTAAMECRLAFKTLLGEFSRRHPGKEMTDVYGRC